MKAGIEIRRQFFATVAANLSMFSFGWNCAWANANFLELQSPTTKLEDGPITKEEASLVVSLVCLGGLIGNITYLLLIDKFGRKNPILFLAVPAIIGWMLVIYAKNAYWLYASRILFGFIGGGGMVSLPIFTSEICSDSVRGMMNSFGFLFNSFGALIAFCTAVYLDYRLQAICALIIPCLFVFVFYFVPESPIYLQNKNRIEEAEMSMEFYKGKGKLPEIEKFVDGKKSKKPTLSFDDFFGTKASRRSLLISIVLVILPQFCGCYILLSYTTAFFEEAGSNWTPIQSSILINVVQLAANAITVFLIDRLGRKIVFVSSSLCTSLGMLILALHRLYREDLPDTTWVPIYVLSLTIFVASIGLLPIPFVITIDVLSPKIRHITMTFCSMTMWILGFLVNIAYLYLLQAIKLHGCLMLFSGSCFVCALFALIFIPETKGKSYEKIEKLLGK